MHTDIDYGKLTGPAKELKAKRDLINWLGIAKYNMLVKEFKTHENMTRQNFMAYMSMAGVQGYPVHVFWETIYGKPWVEAVSCAG